MKSYPPHQGEMIRERTSLPFSLGGGGMATQAICLDILLKALISGKTLLTSKWNLVINLFVAVISTSVLDT